MPREQAGGGDAGGAGEDRGRQGEAGRLDDWQRIEAEKPDRDRVMKEWVANHDPSPAFEQAGRAVDPEAKRARPERIEPGDLTADQRAELEAMSGQPVEHLLERRNQARANDTGAETERPSMQPRADLPGDDAYNVVIGAYNRGEIPYNDAARRLEPLDASPVHGRPLDTSVRDAEPQRAQADLPAEASDLAGSYVRVRLDEHGQPDWSTAEVESGEVASSEVGQEPGRLRNLARLFGHRPDEASDRGSSGDQPVAKTWLESDTRPPPVDTTRVYHRQGFLDPPLPREQQALDGTVPRDTGGTPERFPNPSDQWSSDVNGDGPSTNVFRRNNCLDCSLSAISTWHGEPQVSAPRHAEYDANGVPDEVSGELGGPARAERWLGHTYESIAPDASGYSEIGRRLTDAGHGSSAAILNWWPWGGGHAWNAFNHEGTVYWVDTQHSQVSDKPIYSTPGSLEAIIMDSEGKKA